MANRHLSRSIVLQTLFEWDFNFEKEGFKPKEALKRNIEEFAPGADDTDFMEVLFDLVVKKRTVIDEIITKAAPDWPLVKIANVDRNILRLGLAELLFGDRKQVPPKVAINEAIELAKKFGGEKSSKFINGVLGAVYKEIGEPGKDQKSNKKEKEEIDIASLPIEKKAGCVVFAKEGDDVFFAFVHDVFGYWTLAKGSIEEGENAEQGALREVKEEIGLDVKIHHLLGETEYIASHPVKGKSRKQVSYFLAEGPYEELVLTNDTGGLDDAKWFAMADIENIRTYDDIIPLLAKSITFIMGDQ